MKVIGLIAFFATYLCAAEIVTFNDGRRLIVEGHETRGEVIRLQRAAGWIETPAEAIRQFEQLEPSAFPEPPALSAFELPAPAQPKRTDPHALIEAAAKRHKVPEAILRSIAAAESRFDCEAVSSRGAVGIMQVMPATARELGLDAHVPEENVDAGTRYLRGLLDRYRRYRDGLKRAIAAYNAGPAAVDRWQGVPPYPETQAYVARVLSLMRRFKQGG